MGGAVSKAGMIGIVVVLGHEHLAQESVCELAPTRALCVKRKTSFLGGCIGRRCRPHAELLDESEAPGTDSPPRQCREKGNDHVDPQDRY